MCIALIGGMDRLERHYVKEALKLGIDLRVFTTQEANIGSKIKNADAMVIFTNKVSHKVKAQAIKEAKANGIPVHMQHSCGVCALRNCLDCLMMMNSNGGKIDA
jgi:ABC-type sugar transport system substrate-binding protein